MGASERAALKILKAQEEEARLEREFKEATIKIARQLPVLIDELILLRGAVNRSR